MQPADKKAAVSIIGGREEYSPGPIGEERDGFLVRQVQVFAHGVAANDKHFIIAYIRDDILGSHVQCRHEAGAGSIEVESPCPRGPQPVLQHGGRRGRHVLRRVSGHDEQVQCVGPHTGALQCLQGRMFAEVRYRFVVSAPTMGMDIHILAEPSTHIFTQQIVELAIRHFPRWRVRTRSSDKGAAAGSITHS